MSDATRLTIVMLLREQGELCVCDICAVTAESQPKISRHMAILREGWFLTVGKEMGALPFVAAYAGLGGEIIDSAWRCLRDEVRAGG